MPDAQMMDRLRTGAGFIAALDQSGGSTPKALASYGVPESQYSGEAEMFDLMHAWRVRVISDPAFTRDRILGAILFQGTFGREVEGRPAAEHLWQEKGLLPFLKVDRGLDEERDGVQLMKDVPDLDDVLALAAERGAFGTKERSVVNSADPKGIALVVAQQFDMAERVLAAGLVPIVEPEVTITAPDKAEAEALLLEELLQHLDGRAGGQVVLKLSLPTVDGFYRPLLCHPGVARVVALSGGYSRAEANERLARNPGVIASFSRALVDGLTVHQSREEFTRALDASIESIYQASTT